MLTSPSGKSYIGQTIRTIEDRFEEHRTGKSNGCRAIYNATQYHGWENFEKDWYEVPDEDLNNHEGLMIEVLGTLAPGGYNLKEGGTNGKMSKETKQKMSEASFGKPKSNEHKKNIGEAQLGKKLSEETKQKMSEAQRGEKGGNRLGKTHADDSKQKIRESRVGKTHTEETKQKISEAQQGGKHRIAKRVYQYDLVGAFIGSFGSTREAARHLEKGNSLISDCARGKRETAYGFKWAYIKIV